jgi:hypothetical protein
VPYNLPQFVMKKTSFQTKAEIGSKEVFNVEIDGA